MNTPNIPLRDLPNTTNTGTDAYNSGTGQYNLSSQHLDIYGGADKFKGGVASDTLKNWYVRSMRNKVVQVGVISSVKDKFKYGAYFDDNKFRTNGRAIEYLLPQLKDGIVARKDLSVHKGTDFKRENEIPYVRVKKIMDHVYYDIIVEDRLLEGLQNEGLLGDITDEIKFGISKKIRKDLGRAIETELCNVKDYYIEAKTEGKVGDKDDVLKMVYKPEKEKTPGNAFIYPKEWWGQPDKIITELWKVSSIMLEENTNLQKGWYDEDKMVADDAEWYVVPAEAEGYENLHLIIDYEVDNALIIGQYAKTYNWELLDIRKRFGRVIVTKLGFSRNKDKEVLMIMFQDEALKLRLKGKYSEVGLEHKYEPENGANWFFAKPVAHGGLITALNYACWIRGETYNYST